MSSIWRRAHILKSEKSLAVPRHMVFFDTESRIKRLPNGDTEHTLRLGWACYWRRSYDRHSEREEWYGFRDTDSYWQWLLSHTEEKQKLWVIARNVGFDFTLVEGWRHLRKAGYKLSFFYGKGGVGIISVKSGRRSLVFLDSLNWFRESLASTGERIGVPKMKVDFDTVTDSELSTYCRNDVLIEYLNFKSFQTFLAECNIGRLCYTRGSCAMSAYLLRYYRERIYIHNNREAIAIERESYRGGRVECFYIGTPKAPPYYVIDVNSLYPYVMQQYEYPVRYVKQVYDCSPSEVASYLDRYSMVARCILDAKEPVYAMKRGRTLFPIGRMKAALCSPELEYACVHNDLVKVVHGVLYERADIFSSFVTAIYDLRQEFKSAGNDEYQEFCKYLMNSLYGKFGQKAEIWKKIGDCPNEPDRVEILIDAQKDGIRKLRYLTGTCEELVRYGESFDSFPAISSHVTAYARMMLWSLMQKAGKGHYLYCDTDSLIVDATGLKNLECELSETELGKCKLEQTTQTLIIHGPKDYVTDAKTVIKGIRKSARQLDAGVYEQERWPSLAGRLREGNAKPYTVKMTVKHLNREYLKGTVTESGWVEPFVLSDEV